ncbi:high affinity cGMP-specific 3',5'-cyclic phosphodiesterase 9A-like [Spea bombifrons]|uniref:high affinity cGMP-specific 3',5'-cyclic phosphodiesterase 9A-like n=1 Tax=Spea bombifrons TaxID=233779 RepID=UPI0023496364|nr:high affinity cGMP-specific 3',5'-cyclic phosphodiesterase 9A-like [Spea bombifrons]
MENTTEKVSELSLNQVSSQSDKNLIQLSDEIRLSLKRPSLNVWNIQDKQMLDLLEHMFHDLGLVTEFKMDDKILENFLCRVQNNYRANPFHNFRHGFCVTQMMYSVICACRLQDRLPPADIVGLIVASLCHDLDHPGLNNAYQVNAGTELAARYKNKSPLENHHWAVTQQILSHPQSNIFCNTDPGDATHMQEEIKELILATDMINHGHVLRCLQEIHGMDPSDRKHVSVLKKGLIKFCDISNEVRPAEQAEIWADALLEEYFLQSDREKAEGLPVTPYMDRDTVTKATAQSSFIDSLLLPLCEALGKILPQMNNLALKPLAEAKRRYQRQMEKTHRTDLPIYSPSV